MFTLQHNSMYWPWEINWINILTKGKRQCHDVICFMLYNKWLTVKTRNVLWMFNTVKIYCNRVKHLIRIISTRHMMTLIHFSFSGVAAWGCRRTPRKTRQDETRNNLIPWWRHVPTPIFVSHVENSGKKWNCKQTCNICPTFTGRDSPCLCFCFMSTRF